MNVGDRVNTDAGAGVIVRIHRPGTLKARYNVKLDIPLEDETTDGELIDVVDVGINELEIIP